MAGGSWLATPANKYGGSIAATSPKATPDATATTTVAPVVTPHLAGLLRPSDPMFWFAAIAATTVGLMAYSTASIG